jgi:hypothetical protein
MKLTPLHLALGVNRSDLSIDLIREACAQAVREREDLDWKSTLPITLPFENKAGRDEQQDELAKDIAAMANTRGGLIAYGVAEVAATNAASHIVSVGERDIKAAGFPVALVQTVRYGGPWELPPMEWRSKTVPVFLRLLSCRPAGQTSTRARGDQC